LHPLSIDTDPFSNFTLRSWSKEISVVYSPVKKTCAAAFSGIEGIFSGTEGVVAVCTISTVLSTPVVALVFIVSFEEAELFFSALPETDWLFLLVYGIVGTILAGIYCFTGSTYFGDSGIVVCELLVSEGRAGL
jgi:hypothetical protein